MIQSTNIHLYPAPIVNESRIFRQTRAVADADLVDKVVICGQRREDLPDIELLGRARSIERVGAVGDAGPRSLLGRIRDQISWSIAAYRHWANRTVRIVNAHSVAVLPVSYAIARRHRAALIYDTHELETETSTSGGIQGSIFRLIERVLARRCEAIFVVNESIAAWYRSAYPDVRVVAVRNAPTRAAALEPLDLRLKLSIPDGCRVFVHVGNIVAHRHIQEILQAFAKRESAGDHVVFIGEGALADKVRSYANLHANIHHLGAVSADEVVNAVAGADIGLCLIEPTCQSYALSLPNKALEYAIAGIPFLYTDLVEVEELLGGEMSAWKVTPTVDELAGAIARLDDERIAAGRETIAAAVLPDWTRESERMLDEYRRILGTS